MSGYFYCDKHGPSSGSECWACVCEDARNENSNLRERHNLEVARLTQKLEESRDEVFRLRESLEASQRDRDAHLESREKWRNEAEFFEKQSNEWQRNVSSRAQEQLRDVDRIVELNRKLEEALTGPDDLAAAWKVANNWQREADDLAKSLAASQEQVKMLTAERDNWRSAHETSEAQLRGDGSRDDEMEELRASLQASQALGAMKDKTLEFYAHGHHFHYCGDDDFEPETVSGEPTNWLCGGKEDSEFQYENGGVARESLAADPAPLSRAIDNTIAVLKRVFCGLENGFGTSPGSYAHNDVAEALKSLTASWSPGATEMGERR